MATLVERVSKLIIKPSSPTPELLRIHNLSSIDQMMTSEYAPCAYFYNNPNGHDISKVSQNLQNSISKTLVNYYPFAGRLVNNDYIECNDEGVEFVEVRIHCPMYDIIKKKRSDVTDLVYPRGMEARIDDSLVVIQLSHFDCGGVAISTCISHKIADGSAGVAFTKDLAANTSLLLSGNAGDVHIPAPLLVSDSLFPRRDNKLPPLFIPSKNCVTRKFVFPAAEIEKLKSKAIESGIDQPSRVEVVFALVYQCAMIATRYISCGGLSRPAVMLSAINLRPFLALPQNSVGNIFSSYYFFVNDGEDDERTNDEFAGLVIQQREARLEFQNLPLEKISYESQMKELGERLKELNTSVFDVYVCSSLCGFPIKNIDFGLGNLIHISMMQSQTKETIVLMDSPGNGVQASVTLEEQKMSVFENNQKLLLFAFLDYSKLMNKSKL